MIDSRPARGGSCVGESYNDFMLGWGNLQDIKNSLDKQAGANSFVIPSKSSTRNKDHKKNQKLNAALIKKAMMSQPQSATVKSISTKNGRKKGFDFSFASKDKIEEMP